MKWPKLVTEKVCKVPVVVHFTQGVGEDSAPLEVKTVETRCNYSEKSRQVLDAQRRLVRLEASALFPGDLAPELPQLEGWVEVMGVSREIYQAARGRDPDGAVNFTQLELI